MGSIVTVLVMGNALKYTTVTWSGNGSSHRNLKHDEKHYKEIIHFNKFPMAKDRNSSRED